MPFLRPLSFSVESEQKGGVSAVRPFLPQLALSPRTEKNTHFLRRRFLFQKRQLTHFLRRRFIFSISLRACFLIF
jgi:hypothetical protein